MSARSSLQWTRKLEQTRVSERIEFTVSSLTSWFLKSRQLEREITISLNAFLHASTSLTVAKDWSYQQTIDPTRIDGRAKRQRDKNISLEWTKKWKKIWLTNRFSSTNYKIRKLNFWKGRATFHVFHSFLRKNIKTVSVLGTRVHFSKNWIKTNRFKAIANRIRLWLSWTFTGKVIQVTTAELSTLTVASLYTRGRSRTETLLAL